MRNILITNDDGIDADGLLRLAKTARGFGAVTIVAPASQRSASSHSITLHEPIGIVPYDYPLKDVRAYACSGMPADCIRVGCHYVMAQKPDLVLSGINFGYNIATDIQYSATAGAAFEGSFQGIPSIAFSEGFSGCHEVTDHFLTEILSELIEKDPGTDRVWNVNFPDCAFADCKGILRNRTVSRGAYFRDRYEPTETLPDGTIRLKVVARHDATAEADSDYRAVLDGYISIGTVKNIGS